MKKNAKIAVAAGASALAVGLGVFAYTNKDDNNEVPKVSQVLEPVETTEAEKIVPQLPEKWADSISCVPSENGMTAKSRYFSTINPDIIGWIKMDETKVNYPVVLDPGEIKENTPFYGPEYYIPNSYYLNHDIDGSDLRCGSLFADYTDDFDSNEDVQSENMVIYGHNMANNTMFGSIRRYRQDYAFYDINPFIELSSNYRDYEYVIFAFLITSGNYEGNDFVYWDMEELDTKEDYDFYVNRCKSRSMIDTGVDVQYGDKLVTLSTCYADEDNSRFLVVGRRLRDGEKAGDMTTITRTQEWIKAHEPATQEATSENTDGNQPAQ